MSVDQMIDLLTAARDFNRAGWDIRYIETSARKGNWENASEYLAVIRRHASMPGSTQRSRKLVTA